MRASNGSGAGTPHAVAMETADTVRSLPGNGQRQGSREDTKKETPKECADSDRDSADSEGEPAECERDSACPDEHVEHEEDLSRSLIPSAALLHSVSATADAGPGSVLTSLATGKGVHIPYDMGMRAPWWTQVLLRGRGLSKRVSFGPSLQQGLIRSASESSSSSSLGAATEARLLAPWQPCVAMGDLVIFCAGVPRTESFNAPLPEKTPDSSSDPEEAAMAMIQALGAKAGDVWSDTEFSLSTIDE